MKSVFTKRQLFHIPIDILINIILYSDITTIYELCRTFKCTKYIILKYQHYLFKRLIDGHFDNDTILLFKSYNGLSINKYFLIYTYNIENILENDEFILNYKHLTTSIDILKAFDKLYIFQERINQKDYIKKIYDCLIYHNNNDSCLFFNRSTLNKNIFYKIQNLLLSVNCYFDIHTFIKSIFAYDKKSFKLMLHKHKNIINETYNDMPIIFYIKYSLVELKKFMYVSKKLESFVDSVINILKNKGAIGIWFYNNQYWTIHCYYRYLLDINKDSLKSFKLYQLIN